MSNFNRDQVLRKSVLIQNTHDMDSGISLLGIELLSVNPGAFHFQAAPEGHVSSSYSGYNNPRKLQDFSLSHK